MFGRWRKIRADRRRWAAAQSLPELGELMALWLEGELSVWPGYAPGYGPDDETTELIPLLAAANRAGFVTDQSQPGCDEHGQYGHWQQRAAVSGLVRDRRLMDALHRVADEYDLKLLVSHNEGQTVTRVDGEAHTAFGRYISVRVLRHVWDGISPQAFDEVVGAWQVALIDMKYGRNDRLWLALDAAITEYATTP